MSCNAKSLGVHHYQKRLSPTWPRTVSEVVGRALLLPEVEVLGEHDQPGEPLLIGGALPDRLSHEKCNQNKARFEGFSQGGSRQDGG
jgi:hypothetical protein